MTASAAPLDALLAQFRANHSDLASGTQAAVELVAEGESFDQWSANRSAYGRSA